MEPSLPYSKAIHLAWAITIRLGYEGFEEFSALIKLFSDKVSMDEYTAEAERIEEEKDERPSKHGKARSS